MQRLGILGAVGSRLTLDKFGRRIVVVTTPSQQLAVGTRFRALGNGISTASYGEDGRVYWLGEPDGQRMNAATLRRSSDRDWLPRDA